MDTGLSGFGRPLGTMPRYTGRTCVGLVDPLPPPFGAGTVPSGTSRTASGHRAPGSWPMSGCRHAVAGTVGMTRRSRSRSRRRPPHASASDTPDRSGPRVVAVPSGPRQGRHDRVGRTCSRAGQHGTEDHCEVEPDRQPGALGVPGALGDGRDLLSVRGGELHDPCAVVDQAVSHGCEGLTLLLGGEPFDQAAACAELAEAGQRAGLGVITSAGYELECLSERSESCRRLLAATDPQPAQ